jgi:hypothetical protein
MDVSSPFDEVVVEELETRVVLPEVRGRGGGQGQRGAAPWREGALPPGRGQSTRAAACNLPRPVYTPPTRPTQLPTLPPHFDPPLPPKQGSTRIEYTLPFDMDVSYDKKFTYLDTVGEGTSHAEPFGSAFPRAAPWGARSLSARTAAARPLAPGARGSPACSPPPAAGRPVLVLRKSNVLPVHNKAFAVDYSFGTAALLREPLLLIAGARPAGGPRLGGGLLVPAPVSSGAWCTCKPLAVGPRSKQPFPQNNPFPPPPVPPRPPVFASFFLAVAVYYRLEFTISKDDAWLAARTREAAAATLQRLSGLWDEEAEALERVAGVTDALADAVGIEAANAARHAAEAKLRALDAQVGRAQGRGGGGWRRIPAPAPAFRNARPAPALNTLAPLTSHFPPTLPPKGQAAV